MANIRINALPEDAAPNQSDVLPVDGLTTRKTTIVQMVDAARPFASQAEAEAGIATNVGMNPLTTAQAIASQGATQFATAAQGALASTALQPAAIGTTVQAHDALLDSVSGLALSAGDILYATGADTVARLPIGAESHAIISQGGLPVWSPAGVGDMLAVNNLSDVDSAPAALTNLGFGAAGKAIAAGATEADVRDYLGAAIGFATRTQAAAFSPATAPDYIRVAGFATAGDGGGALYKNVGSSEPSHAGKFSITLDDTVTVVWFEIADEFVRPEMFGAIGDGIVNDLAAFTAARSTGKPIILTLGKIYALSSQLNLDSEATIYLNGATIAARAGITDKHVILWDSDDVQIYGPGTIDGTNLPPMTTNFVGNDLTGITIATNGPLDAGFTTPKLRSVLKNVNVTAGECGAIYLAYCPGIEVENPVVDAANAAASFDTAPAMYFLWSDNARVSKPLAKNTKTKGIAFHQCDGFQAATLKVEGGIVGHAQVFVKESNDWLLQGVVTRGGFGVKFDNCSDGLMVGQNSDCQNIGDSGLLIQGCTRTFAQSGVVNNAASYSLGIDRHLTSALSNIDCGVSGYVLNRDTTTKGDGTVGILLDHGTQTNSGTKLENILVRRHDYCIKSDNNVPPALDNLELVNVWGEDIKTKYWEGPVTRLTSKGGGVFACLDITDVWHIWSPNASAFMDIDGFKVDDIPATATWFKMLSAADQRSLIRELRLTNWMGEGGLLYIDILLNDASEYIRSLHLQGNQCSGGASADGYNLSNAVSANNVQVLITGNSLLSATFTKQNIAFVETAVSGKWNGVVEDNMATPTNKPNNV